MQGFCHALQLLQVKTVFFTQELQGKLAFLVHIDGNAL